MVMAVAAMAMMTDAETEVHGSDVGANNIGIRRRPAKQGQSEERGNQQFHEWVSRGMGACGARTV
jgi:hypothetical protein